MDEAIQAAKRALRGALLERRGRLGAAEVGARSAAITRAIVDHPVWARARGVAAFVGVAGEPDTRALLGAARAAGKRLWLPRVLRSQGRLEFVVIDDLEALAPAAFGLWEPRPSAGEIVSAHPEAVDLVLVPGLAFDGGGARLGFGKGYYDRALAPLRERVTPARVGVCFAEFVAPRRGEGAIPVAAWDVGVHAVASEGGLTWVDPPGPPTGADGRG